jgi:hypothetical protein
MQDLFTSFGIDHTFVEGVTSEGKKRNVAAAMRKAHERFAAPPFMVCEDDLFPLRTAPVLPPPPDGADIVYLANSSSGCLPERPDYRQRYLHRAFGGLALAEDHDADYVRLWSMISAIAILILTEKGRLAWREQLRKAYNRDTAIDVRFAYSMPDLAVYALRKPMFAEDPSLQPKGKRTEERRLLTHSPLPLAHEGEERVSEGTLYHVRVCARRNPETRGLEWEVLEDRPKPRAYELSLVPPQD